MSIELNHTNVTSETFLPPIEKPRGLMMKLASTSRRQFGKVFTPLKVHCALLPVAFGMFYGKVATLDKKLRRRPETILLIRHQVARINVCQFLETSAVGQTTVDK